MPSPFPSGASSPVVRIRDRGGIRVDGPSTVCSVEGSGAVVAHHHRAVKFFAATVRPGISELPLPQQCTLAVTDSLFECI